MLFLAEMVAGSGRTAGKGTLTVGGKIKEYLLTAKLIIVFVSLQSTALISKSYVLQITEFGIIVAKDLKDSCCSKP